MLRIALTHNRLFALCSALLVASFFAMSAAHAVTSGITYHGRILEPDGVTPITGSVLFKMQIRTPDSSNCLMYEEWQTISLAGTNGVFALTLNDGTGTRHDSSGYTIDTIFANRGTFTFAPSTCFGSSSYTPGIGDGRNLQVSFRAASMIADEAMPLETLNFAPLAIEAQQISGFQATNLLRFQNSDGTLVNTSPLDNAQYTNLLSLLAGTSTQYSQASTASGTEIISASGTITSPTIGSMWLDTSSNTIKVYTSSGVETVATSSSGNFLTAVTAGAGLTVTTTGNTANVGIGTSGITNGMLADNAVTASKIASGAVSASALDPAISISTSGSVSAAGVSTRNLILSTRRFRSIVRTTK